MSQKNCIARNCARIYTDAFTLSEVLITLAIIGVVAIMTISIINKANDMQTAARAKKAYSVIANATNSIMQDNGGNMTMDMSGSPTIPTITTYYKNIYKPYIASSAECDNQAACTGKLWPLSTDWYQYDGIPVSSAPGGFYYEACILGADGMTYRLYFYDYNCTQFGYNVCGTIMFDTNGMKKPNIQGKDIFTLYITKSKIIMDPFDSNLTLTKFLTN